MVRAPIIILLGALLLWSAVAGASAQDAVKAQGDSTIALQFKRGAKQGHDAISFRYNEKTTSFDLIWYGTDAHPEFLLVKKVVDATAQTYGQEYAVLVNHFDVTAYEVEGHMKGAALYALDVVPDAHDEYQDLTIVEGYDEFLRVYTGARQGESELNSPAGPYRYYDIRTGRLLFLADGTESLEKIFLEGEAKPSRFIGVSTRQPAPFKSQIDLQHEYIATLSYGSDHGIIQKVRIEATDAAREAAKLTFDGADAHVRVVRPGSEGNSPLSFLPHAAIDSDSFDKVSVWVELTSTVGVEIPLVKDRLAIENAILPAGFSISLSH